MSEFPNVQPYLKSICDDDRYQQLRCTATDAVGKEQQSKSESQLPFNFSGLMVQTVSKENRDPRHEEKERIERFPVVEGIRKYAKDHVLLVGRPGAGKSTALARLLLEEAMQQTSLPVLVELRYWQGSIEQLILNSFARHGLPLTVDQLETVLSRCLILFDGVNELPSEEARIQLSAFRRNHPKVPMIFTTRDLSLGGDLGIEKQLEMQPLIPEQMQDFIRSYVPEQAEQMLRQLKDRLRELGQTPLLLWMLCQLFQQTGEIPDNLGMVFRLFTQGYERNLKQDVVIESDRAWWKPVLQQLAWVMMQGETPTEFRVAIPREEAVRAIAQFLNGKVPYAEDFTQKCLRDLQKHHLIQAGSNPEELEFRHQLIQEYYAAEALLEQLPKLDDKRLKRDFLNFLKWTEPMALMLALIEDETFVLRVVQQSLSVDLILGVRLAGEVKFPLREKTIELVMALEISPPIKKELLERGKSIASPLEAKSVSCGKDNTQVGKGLEVLDEKILEICSVIANSDSKSRWRAAQELERLIDFPPNEELKSMVAQKAIPCLLDLIHHLDPDVRWCVAHSFLVIGDRNATQGLLKLLKDPSDDVRKSAALALGEIRDENAILGLLEFLQNPTTNQERIDELRGFGAYALSEIGGKKTIISLLSFLNNPDENLRWYAIDALGDASDELVIVGLISRLRDCSSRVRSKAVYTLSQIGNKAIVPELVAYLQCLPVGSDECYSIVNALAEIGDEAAIPELRLFLEKSSGWLRESAVLALGKLGDQTVVQDLLNILRFSQLDTKTKAAEILSQIDAVSTVVEIVDFLMNDAYLSATPTIKTLNALKRFKGNKAAHALPSLLTHIDASSDTYKIGIAFRAIQNIQENCKYYNYEIYQAYLEAQKIDRQQSQTSDRSSSVISNFPNATEVKIFEKVDRYYETPPREPPS